jgi:hypothetical protein
VPRLFDAVHPGDSSDWQCYRQSRSVQQLPAIIPVLGVTVADMTVHLVPLAGIRVEGVQPRSNPTTDSSRHGCVRCADSTRRLIASRRRWRALVQNLRRGHYGLGIDRCLNERIRIAFDELAVSL